MDFYKKSQITMERQKEKDRKKLLEWNERYM